MLVLQLQPFLGGGVHVTGIVTATTVKVGSAISITDGAVSATRFHGDGTNLTGIDAAPSTTAVASGSIANGATVALNIDGTVSEVAAVNVSLGSTTQFESGGAYNISAAYDGNETILVVYRETTSGNDIHYSWKS